MALRADEAGFLIGERISDLQDAVHDVDGNLEAMAQDIAAIRGLLSATQRAAQPATRDANGRFVSGEQAPERAAVAAGRDPQGLQWAAVVERFAGKVQEAVRGGMDDAGRVDPAMQAFQEVAQPLSRGVGVLFDGGGERRKERWYKRLWQSLRRKEALDTAADRVTQRRLREIAERPVGDGSGGWLALAIPLLLGIVKGIAGLPGLLLGGLGSVLAKALPGALLQRLPAIGRGGAGGGTGAGGSAGGRGRRDPPNPPNPPPAGGGRLRRMARGLRGVRGLGAVGALLGVASLVGTETDDSLTREEKNQEHGATVGRAATGMAGAAAGAAIGTMIFPGIGTVVGGIVGGVAADYFVGDAGEDVGGKVATWLSGEDFIRLPGKISDTFGGWVDDLKKTGIGKYLTDKWDTLTTDIKSGWDKISAGFSGALDSANQWVKDKTGVDVKQAATAAASVVSDAASQVVTGRKNSVNERWQAAKGDIVGAAKAADVDAGILAAIAHFESSGFNPDARPVAKDASKNAVRQFDGTMAISSAHGYGQFLDGTWTEYINKYGAKYGVEGAGNLSKEQAGKYRKDTKLQAAMLAEFTKENVETGRKLGGKDDLANVYALHNLGSGDGKAFLDALKNNPSAKISSVLSGKVIAGNGSLYKGGNITVAEAYANMGDKMREGDSYAQEARNLQNGTVAPISPAGLIGMASSAYSMGKAAYDKGKSWADGVLPESVKNLKVKASDGKTRTLQEMGVSSYADLQAKGGQAFSGGYNNPETLYATNLIANGLGSNFDRVTAQNDLYHQQKAPNSAHTKGSKTDFTVKGISSVEADKRITEIMAKYGLVKGVDFQTIDEYAKPTAKATGGHIDFKLHESGQAKIAQVMAMEQSLPRVPAVGSGVQVPRVPPMPAVASVPDAPLEMSPALNSSKAANPITLALPDHLVGQDVRDRRIAHIATGGLGG